MIGILLADRRLRQDEAPFEDIGVDLAGSIGGYVFAGDQAGIPGIDNRDMGAFRVAEDPVPLADGIINDKRRGFAKTVVAQSRKLLNNGVGAYKGRVYQVDAGISGHVLGDAGVGLPFHPEVPDAALGVAGDRFGGGQANAAEDAAK